MAKEGQGLTTTHAQWEAQSPEAPELERPKGWKYRSLKLGPVTLPYYASPEMQLILVSFVCFLCPGKFADHVVSIQDL